MANESERLDAYLEEIREIKGMLRQHEDGGYVSWWAYLVWGLTCLAGSSAHLAIALTAGISAHTAFLAIWLPAILVGGVSEFVGWLMKSGKTGKPLFAGQMLRFLLQISAFTFYLILVLSLVVSLPDAPVSAVVWLTAGIAFIVFARQTLDMFHAAGAVLMAIGFILYFLGLDSTAATLSAGLASALVLLEGSVTARRLERS